MAYGMWITIVFGIVLSSLTENKGTNIWKGANNPDILLLVVDWINCEIICNKYFAAIERFIQITVFVTWMDVYDIMLF